MQVPTKESIVDIAISKLGKFNVPTPTLEELFNDIAQAMDEDPVKCKSKSRKREYVTVRAIFCYVANFFTGYSLIQISSFYGGKEHTGALHHRESVKGFIDREDPKFMPLWNRYINFSKLWDNIKVYNRGAIR